MDEITIKNEEALARFRESIKILKANPNANIAQNPLKHKKMEEILKKNKAELNASVAQNANKIIENILDANDASSIYKHLNDIIYHYSYGFMSNKEKMCGDQQHLSDLEFLRTLRDAFYSPNQW